MDLPSFPQYRVNPRVADRPELSATRPGVVLRCIVQLLLIGLLILSLTIPVWWPALVFWDP